MLIVLALGASHCASGFQYANADAGTGGFKTLPDGAIPSPGGGAGRVFSPTEWRHKFLVSPAPARLGGHRRASKGSMEAFALQARPHAMWEGAEGEGEAAGEEGGKGDVL